MSGKFLSRAWIAPLPARQKLVLMTLGDWSNEDGNFSTCLYRVSDQCGMSAVKTNRCIIRLVNKGFVQLQEGSDYAQLSGALL